MLRQASSRNQRSKGFKVRHALQICLLFAICIWLLYQVKHSHEKKRALEERASKILNKVVDSQADFFKFGRKDLPHIEETGSVPETHSKEEENEETQEEEEEEHDAKQEEIEDEEGRGVVDDDIDEQDRQKGDEEEEDSHDENKNGHDEADMFDNQEYEGGTQEAREENYKNDDASSAVVHDTHVTESETGIGGAGNTDEEQVIDKAYDDSGADGFKDDKSTDGSKSEVVPENSEKKVESENVTNGTDDGSRGNSNLSAGSEGALVSNASETVLKYDEAIRPDNFSSNTTSANNKDMEVDIKDVEVEFSKPDNGSVSNSTTIEYNNQMEQQTNLTKAAESNSWMELQSNSTRNESDHHIEMQNSSPVGDAARIFTSNDTTSLNSAKHQNVAAGNATLEENAYNSQPVVDPAEKSNTTIVLESEEHSKTSAIDENRDAAQGESENSSQAVITEEEKDARTDLSTLPENQNEVKMTDDETAE